MAKPADLGRGQDYSFGIIIMKACKEDIRFFDMVCIYVDV